jgi:predicted alpha/beta superfamily hydrolase
MIHLPRLTRLIFAALVALAFAAASYAQTAPDAGRLIVIGRSYAMRSAVLGNERRINVYLPDDYGDARRSFPVVFLLDGGEKEDFHHITGLAQINAAYGQGREVIVVGIEGVDRRHDLTSPSASAADRKRLPTSGGAAAYRRFLTEELKPWVAARYRTDGRTALMGESLAGLFVAETLLRAPASFDDYIAVSPSLWWNSGALAAEAADDLRRDRFSGQRALVAFDDPAPPAEQAAKERREQAQLAAAFAQVKPAGLTWTVTRPGKGHAGIYHPAAMEAFHALYGPPGS